MPATPFGCLHPGCGRAASTRGCCLMHYKRLRARVLAGEVTWGQLAAAGECQPVNAEGRQRWASQRIRPAGRRRPAGGKGP